MATNPKLPREEQNHPDDHAHIVLTRRRTNPWPIILVVIAAIILLALIGWVIFSRPHPNSSVRPNGAGVVLQTSAEAGHELSAG
jgi:hypothetical protein